ncbi:polysaccharide deacetylase family protein [Phyllobacterium endophyticum]|uniref:Chitooligosaccharide deacetylase n=1 Tax=Phyllobacterium endophyticum TaxID=1149773 RepID=A0A2P7ANX2_9HYPH|nr:polysaccharide deacetylase family protein [Phyllobacterium endophyticum]MBB3233752.1 peptidoglycan/xylan/chitin deacetylase (PgdA/CDA1 family) [Phyllobacterium endophyticum]PSH55905.1 polysaccharide deacetylase [Phyllobacterium endophyticum]TXR47240.1 polysaccharide deacetylase family protein [Phyllobacterium endophyticum]TYR41048.1 polysaccharide deacetylase family protein [Phyllobacterium endophyticum]
MEADAVWRPLQEELARWSDANRCARFWLRDDDAVEPTDALERLLSLSDGYGIPLTLAVIPLRADARLARRLAQQQNVTVAVHGWSHRNYAPPDEKKQELGPHRAQEVVSDELRGGHRRLNELFPASFVPVLVPPWNRIDPLLVSVLQGIGFKALSVFGPTRMNHAAYLPVVNTHIDLMDWHGTRGCRDHGQLVEALVNELRLRFGGDEEPIGILTHHLVHDESAWSFLQKLFAIMAAGSGARWVSLRELI